MLPSRLGSKTAALAIGEQQALSAQLLAEYLIFLFQVLDDILLTAIYPSSEERYQELQLQSVHAADPT
jgi:hypothetical protein